MLPLLLLFVFFFVKRSALTPFLFTHTRNALILWVWKSIRNVCLSRMYINRLMFSKFHHIANINTTHIQIHRSLSRGIWKTGIKAASKTIVINISLVLAHISISPIIFVRACVRMCVHPPNLFLAMTSTNNIKCTPTKNLKCHCVTKWRKWYKVFNKGKMNFYQLTLVSFAFLYIRSS